MIVSPITIVLRFIFGTILATAVALGCGLSFPLNFILVLGVATMAAVWGDRFILGFMALMRYFR
jgi:hypothetical protein